VRGSGGCREQLKAIILVWGASDWIVCIGRTCSTALILATLILLVSLLVMCLSIGVSVVLCRHSEVGCPC
jgi:hypothetical protein